MFKDLLKDKKKLAVIIVSILLVILAIFLIVRANKPTGRTSVAEEYKYNTVILSNENAPNEEEPQAESISGYVEDKEQKLVELPYAIEKTEKEQTTTVLEIVSIGKYSGPNFSENSGEELEDVFAMILKNPTDRVLSIATIKITYADGLTFDVNPSNIPPQQSTLVLAKTEVNVAEENESEDTSDKEVILETKYIPYADVKKFECTVDLALQSDKLPLLEGTVGVDYKDGNFIITNLTSEYLGDVYVRYQNFSQGNTYLGGQTFSVVAQEVLPYETYIVPDPNFSKENSVIICVESVKD